MSPLLIVAVVLLVLVVGLTLMQRRAQAQPAPPGRAPSALPPLGPAAPKPSFQVRTDPEIGLMSFDDGIWLREDDLEFAGTTVLLEIHGTADGPTDDDREMIRLATAQQVDIETRARAMVLAELTGRGVNTEGLEAYELALGPDDDGVRSAYLWYDASDFSGEIGVKSTDRWQTLTLEVLE